MEGTPFGRYLLLELLGSGGMGEVWRAFDNATERVVALKVLPARYAHDAVFQQRFRREARAAAGLNDPHVVPIHDFGELDGRLYVTMRLIEGRDLASMLAEGPLEPARAVYILDQVASALNAAHRIGLVHRDVKPSNILVGEDDFAYLIDFGLARVSGETSLTNTGNIVGTWAYLAPERAAGQTDQRADIYALACVLHECLTGYQPFPGDSLEQQLAGHLTSPPPRPSTIRTTLPTDLDAVIARGMAKNPNERYATTKELSTAARAALGGGPATGPQPAWPAQPIPQPYNSFPAQFGPTPAPIFYAPPPGPPPGWPPYAPPGSQPRRRRRWIAVAGGAAALVTLVVAVVLVVVFARNGQPAKSSTAGPTSTANTGSFTGTYRAEFSAPTSESTMDPASSASTGTWAVRSACRSGGCVATATATGGPTLQSTFVFDDVGGTWHAVAVNQVASLPPGVSGSGSCTFPAEYWTVITLEPRGEGTLVGKYRASSATANCLSERTVTFTRTGNVDAKTLPDPADQAARVPSAADGWHGRYHANATPDSGHLPISWETVVQTDCLRTAERCVTFTKRDNGWGFLIFADGKWVLEFDGVTECTLGGIFPTKMHWDLPLPPGAQNPITQVTGHGHAETIGGQCGGAYNEDLKFDRTGD